MERQILTEARTVFAHDLDGVHYSYDAFDDIVNYNGDVNARVTADITELGISYERALRMNKVSYKRYGDGFHMTLQRGQELGMDIESLRDKLHADYHRTLWLKVNRLTPEILLPCTETLEYFEYLKGSSAHGVITQSHSSEWAVPVLTNHKTIGYFSQGAIFGYAEFQYENKAISDMALRTHQKHFGAKPEEMVFLEDSHRNLKRGKQFSEKLLTVYICGKRPFDILPDYIDMQVPTLRHFFAEVARVQAAAKIRKPSMTPVVPKAMELHI